MGPVGDLPLKKMGLDLKRMPEKMPLRSSFVLTTLSAAPFYTIRGTPGYLQPLVVVHILASSEQPLSISNKAFHLLDFRGQHTAAYTHSLLQLYFLAPWRYRCQLGKIMLLGTQVIFHRVGWTILVRSGSPHVRSAGNLSVLCWGNNG